MFDNPVYQLLPSLHFRTDFFLCRGMGWGELKRRGS